MANSQITQFWRRANDVLLAPVVALPNVGISAVHGTIGLTARTSQKFWERVSDTAEERLGGEQDGIAWGAGKFAERISELVADRSLGRFDKSVRMIRRAGENALGAAEQNDDEATDENEQNSESVEELNSNELLSRTVIGSSAATAGIPVMTVIDIARAAWLVDPVREGLYSSWISLSRTLGVGASHGILQGKQRAEADSKLRFGFYYMSNLGPLRAVAQDVQGVPGGALVFMLGDFIWPSKGAKDYWVSMEYVYDKWLAKETQPESDMPIGEFLAWLGRVIVKRFPHPYVEALDSGDPERVVSDFRNDLGELLTMLALYPFSAVSVAADVGAFIARAWLQVSDALNYALCEYALVRSKMSDEDKLHAEKKLRMTAGNATIEFEYYVPLLVPADGTVADQVHRGNVIGERIDHGTIAKSVFKKSAILRAQEITSEVTQRRAFLWLFGDEKRADKATHDETVRKFGKDAAERIRNMEEPNYPLTAEQIEGLTADGVRSEKQVDLLLYDLLRRRGLLEVARKFYQSLYGTLPDSDKFGGFIDSATLNVDTEEDRILEDDA